MNISTNYNNLPPRQDPNVYAQQFATQNGISIDEAKNQLRTQFGDPQANDESIFNNYLSESGTTNSTVASDAIDNTEDTGFMSFITNLFGLNSNEGQQDLDPDEVAQEYAVQNNLTLDEAKVELRELYGNPTEK